MTYLKLGAVTLLALVATSAMAMAEDASYGVRVTAHVPLICSLDAAYGLAQPDGGGRFELGAVTEFCNSGSGFEVWLDSTPANVGAAVEIAGRNIPLSRSGTTLIDASPVAAKRVRTIVLTNAQQLKTVSLRIVPK